MFNGWILYIFKCAESREVKSTDLQYRINPVGSYSRGVLRLETTKADMREVVYANLYQLYSRYAMECFPYLTADLTNLISASAYAEMIQMIQGGYIKDYYERIKRNAV